MSSSIRKPSPNTRNVSVVKVFPTNDRTLPIYFFNSAWQEPLFWHNGNSIGGYRQNNLGYFPPRVGLFQIHAIINDTLIPFGTIEKPLKWKETRYDADGNPVIVTCFGVTIHVNTGREDSGYTLRFGWMEPQHGGNRFRDAYNLWYEIKTEWLREDMQKKNRAGVKDESPPQLRFPGGFPAGV